MENQLTLSELNEQVKEVLQGHFIAPIWVVAEIGEMNQNRTGHCYLELVEKDDATDSVTARARATIWSWQFRFIKPFFESATGQTLSAGLKVLVSASIEFHEVYGFSLNIKDIDPNYTLGDMARKRREIIEQLTNDGVIDMNKELDFPEIPSRVAIISSPTAAGYEDFVNQITNNAQGFYFNLKLFPALMQGNEAASSIIQALNEIYELEDHFDVVVLIRGGGSQLDLNCFDDYELAVNLAQFPLPVLTGIGHEKDESIADMVAHTRLKTPTAVAEFLIGCFDVVYTEIEELRTQFSDAVDDLLSEETHRLNHALKMVKPLVGVTLGKLTSKLNRLSDGVFPLVQSHLNAQQFQIESLLIQTENMISGLLKEHLSTVKYLKQQTERAVQQGIRNERLQNDHQTRNFKIAIERCLHQYTEQLNWLEKSVSLVDPMNVLKRGYSITTLHGKPIKSNQKVHRGDLIETQLFEGKLISKVEKD